MKTRNKRVGLFALSALCLSCCAFGVGTVKNVAKAEEGESIFAMQSGAGVYVGTGYCGIRWTTDISSAYYTANFDANTKFYTLITKSGETVSADFYSNIKDKTAEELETMGYKVMEAACEETTSGYQFTAAIKYETPKDDAQLQLGAEAELIARAYAVKADGTVIYADGYADTARNMEGVATAALLSGSYSDKTDNLKKYMYGESVRENAETQTTVLDHADSYYQTDVTENKGKANLKNADAGTYSVYADSKLIEANFVLVAGGDNTSIVLDEFFNDLTAENLGDYKNLTLVGDNGKLYYQPVQYVSRAISNQAELYDTLKITKLTVTNATNYFVTLNSHDGYYILTSDIVGTTEEYNIFKECKDVTDSKNPTTPAWFVYKGSYQWMATPYTNRVNCHQGGLTGTFDGKGYTISGLTVKGNGIFGMINGGTVKNINIENNTLTANVGESRATLAFSMNDATLESVRVAATEISDYSYKASGNATDGYTFATTVTSISGNAWDRALLAVVCGGATTMKNCIFECDEIGGLDKSSYRRYGSLFTYIVTNASGTFICTDDNGDNTITNTYVISPYAFLNVSTSTGFKTYDYTEALAKTYPNSVSDSTTKITDTTTIKGVERYVSLNTASEACETLRATFVGEANN